MADQSHDSSAVNRNPILLRDARREDVPEIVALLADDQLGAGREGLADDAYFAAFSTTAESWGYRQPGARPSTTSDCGSGDRSQAFRWSWSVGSPPLV